MRARLEILATAMRAGPLRVMVAGHALFAISEAAAWLAILVYANNQGGAGEVGVVAVVQLIPPGLCAPMAGVAADRFGRRRVLALGYLGLAVALAATALAIGLDAHPWAVYAISAVASGTMATGRPAIWSLLPWVVRRPAELTAANVAGGLAESSGLLVGPGVAGVVLGVGGVEWVFAVAATAMVVATTLAVRIDVLVEPTGMVSVDDRARDSRFAAARSATRAVTESHTAVVVAVMTVGFLVLGAVDVATVLVAGELSDSDGLPGFLAAASGAGAVLGAGSSVGLVGRRHLLPSLAIGALLVGGPLVAVGWTESVPLALGLFAVNGAGAAMIDIGGRTMIQRTSEVDVLARVFGVLESLTMFAMAVGAVLVAVLAEAYSTTTALVVSGLALPATLVVFAVGLFRIDRATEPPDAAVVELILGVEFLAPLPSPVVEQLALNMERSELAVGTQLIEQGARGERFYIVESGELLVSRDEREVAHARAGGFVGEVALLGDGVRTASVRCVEPAIVHALDQEVFLEAVTGHPQSITVATAVSTARRPTAPDRPS